MTEQGYEFLKLVESLRGELMTAIKRGDEVKVEVSHRQEGGTNWIVSIAPKQKANK